MYVLCRYTPLMWAARCNHLEVAALLLQAGADTQAVAEDGGTALDLAGRWADPGEMRRLLTGTACITYTRHAALPSLIQICSFLIGTDC